ncbi:MAG: hypothetical protein AAFN07_07260 [Pseudomonadota bacterium]
MNPYRTPTTVSVDVTQGRPLFLPFLAAAAYAALCQSLLFFASTPYLGGALFVIVFFVTLVCAAVMSPLFALARTINSEVVYFSLHLVGAGVCGLPYVLSAKTDISFIALVANPGVFVSVPASLSAWWYVFLSVGPGRRPKSGSEQQQLNRFAGLVIWAMVTMAIGRAL